LSTIRPTTGLTTPCYAPISGPVQEDEEYPEQADPPEVPGAAVSDAGTEDRHREQAEGRYRPRL